MHPVFIGNENIGSARNWKAAEILVVVTRGGKWKVAKVSRLFGRKRRWVYVARRI